MGGSIFPLSLISTVSLTPPAQQVGVPNEATICIVTQDAVPADWAAGQQFETYFAGDLTQVGVDFGVTSNTYALAKAVYAANPNIFAVPGAYLVILPRLQSPSLESVSAAIARGRGLVYFYGVVIDQELADSAPSTFASLASYVETAGVLFGYASSNANDLNSGSPLDLVRQAGDEHTRCTYYGQTGVLLNGAGAQQTQIFAAEYLSLLLSVNYLASNSTLTMAYKNLVGIPADGSLTSGQITAAQAAGVDIYPDISSIVGVYPSGANQFSDFVSNSDWLALAVQVAGVNEIVGQATKLPQTEAGMKRLKDALQVPLVQAVANGFLAPGSWPVGGATFGNQASFLRNISQQGYYIYSTPISQLTQQQLSTRVAPPIQIAALTAGAIQQAAITISVALG